MSDKPPEWAEKAEERVERIEEHARETLDEATGMREDIEEATSTNPSTAVGADVEGYDDGDYKAEADIDAHGAEGTIVGIDLGGGGGSKSGGTTDD